MRTGRAVQAFQGHVKQILGLDCHPHGHTIVRASRPDPGPRPSLRQPSRHVPPLALRHAQLGARSDGARSQASGSDDHTVRLWDLRKKKASYTLPAHSSLISHVRFEPTAGRFLLSTSYDNKVKLWSTRDYALLHTMQGHEGRVMCGDIADDGKHFATAAMDRTWKLWG